MILVMVTLLYCSPTSMTSTYPLMTLSPPRKSENILLGYAAHCPGIAAIDFGSQSRYFLLLFFIRIFLVLFTFAYFIFNGRYVGDDVAVYIFQFYKYLRYI